MRRGCGGVAIEHPKLVDGQRAERGAVAVTAHTQGYPPFFSRDAVR